jgi:hypothetical protein
MASSLEALQALAGGGMRANDPLKLAALRRQSLTDVSEAGEGGIGGFGASPQFQAETQQDLALDPNTGIGEQNRVAGIQQHQQQVHQYLGPEETQIRKAAQADALQKLLLPIITKGKFDVDAAGAKATAAEATQQRGFEQQSALQGQRDDATSARAEANSIGTALRQRLLGLQTGKIKPEGPGGFSGMFTSSEALKNAEIAKLMQQIQASEGGNTMSSAPTTAPAGGGGMVIMTTPQGRRISVPESDVATLEAHGARRQ